MIDDLLFRRSYAQRVFAVTPDALIAYWPLSEPSGAAAIEQTGRAGAGAYTGVEIGHPSPDGHLCPRFDGTNDYCNIYSAALTSAFNNQEGAVQAWVRVASAGVWTDVTLRRAVILQADSNNRVRLERSTTSNRFDCVYGAGGTSKSAGLTGLSSVDWLHIVLTWSKSADQVKAYLNGAQPGATLTGLGVWVGALGSSTTVIGAQSTAPAGVWNGDIAHVAVWARALTAAEISELARVS